MFGLPLAFAAPTVLAALALLAALYIFLKVTPPRPRQAVFPPLRLLIGLDAKDATPAKTPWPLLALRIAIAALVILAMAGPIWSVSPTSGAGAGPLLLLIDDGWPAAPTWERRIAFARDALRSATRAGRLAAVLPISEGGLDVAALAVEAIELGGKIGSAMGVARGEKLDDVGGNVHAAGGVDARGEAEGDVEAGELFG